MSNTMDEPTIRALVALEYEFLLIDTAMSTLFKRLFEIGLPETQASARTLFKARLLARRALGRIDVPLTDAIQASEADSIDLAVDPAAIVDVAGDVHQEGLSPAEAQTLASNGVLTPAPKKPCRHRS